MNTVNTKLLLLRIEIWKDPSVLYHTVPLSRKPDVLQVCKGRKQKRFQGRKLRTDQKKYEEDGVQKMGRSMFSRV
ncbi:hypothetical protein CapIbe_018123 [Capra ibex]